MFKAILYHFCPSLRPKPTLQELVFEELQSEQRLLLQAFTDQERAQHEVAMRIARVNRLGQMFAQYQQQTAEPEPQRFGHSLH